MYDSFSEFGSSNNFSGKKSKYGQRPVSSKVYKKWYPYMFIWKNKVNKCIWSFLIIILYKIFHLCANKVIANPAAALAAVILLSLNPTHVNPPINEPIAMDRTNLIIKGGS